MSERIEINDAQKEAIAILVDRVNDLLPPTFVAYWSDEVDTLHPEALGGLIIGRVDGQEMDGEQEEMLNHIIASAMASGVDTGLPYGINFGESEKLESAHVAYESGERDLMEEVERYG